MDDLSRPLALIRGTNPDDLLDQQFLELEWLPALGLNNEALHEFPPFLHAHCGVGLRSWQYPSQFARYLWFLGSQEIESYAEIGVRWGGTFIITVEYLRRFGMARQALAIDTTLTAPMCRYASMTPGVRCLVGDSHSARIREELSRAPFDLVLIDGDHSCRGVAADYEAVRSSRIVVLHDMASDACPGVRQVWQEIVDAADPADTLLEFTDQYPEVQVRTGRRYLGIGVVKRHVP